MKVLFVDQFGKTTGRDTLALAELVNKNSDISVEVFLSETTEIPPEKKYSVKIIKGFHRAYEGNFINKAINYLKALRELKEYIEINNIDIVHLQWFSLPWIEWRYVGELSKRCKIVITVHDIIPFDNRLFEMRALDKIYLKADRLLIHTESSKLLFEKNYKSKTPISIITQGFCLKSDYKRIDREKAKVHFNIPEDAVVFLYYGTIRPSKGLDLLIKAIGEAHKENASVYLLAAGAFHRVDENEMNKVVSEYLNADFSTMNFGFVPQEEERWYFSAADVLCLPYLEVTQSGVAQLGLMYDLPIIATDVGEMRDVCRNEYNGYLIEKNNIDELAKKIVSLANDQEFRIKASMNSMVLGKKDFSLEKKAMHVENAYRKSLEL